MSLLLQALKKAEEDKRRRAALTAEPELSTEFPALNLVDDESAVPEPSNVTAVASEIEPPSDWVFSSLEAAAPTLEPTLESISEEASLAASDISTAEPKAAPMAELPPVIIAAPAAVLEPPIAEPASVQLAAPSPNPAAAKANQASVAAQAELIAPASQIAPQTLAKSLFAKSQRPQGRGLLPWLVLSAGLLLAGMLAWFTWQYQQLTQPSPKLAVNPVASAPIAQTAAAGYVSEPIINEEPQPNTPESTAISVAMPSAVPLSPPAANQSVQPASRVRDAPSEQNLAPKFIRQTANLSATEPVILAWQAYQSGDFAQAERIYRKVLQSDPRQRDAILGLAAIAQQRGDLADAESLYRRLLRFNPQDDAAKAALLGLNSAQMPEKDAVQLEQSGKADPLVLGHYFAAQQRWSQAQEQFFLAYTANPNNADAALNLAVSLDHLNQTTLARSYYRKALQAKEQINFDRSKVEQRLAELDSAAEQQP